MSIKLHNVFSLPVPLHLDIGNCYNNCIYCFTRTSRQDSNITIEPQTTLRQIEKAITKIEIKSLLDYYIVNRYPICINNRSDIFGIKNKDYYFNIIKLLKDAGFNFYFQTKGIKDKKDQNFLHDILTKKDYIYFTITTFNNEKKKEIEPLAPEINLKLIKELKKITNIAIGFNPAMKYYLTPKEIKEYMFKNKDIVYCAYDFHAKNYHKCHNKKLKKLKNFEYDEYKEIIDYCELNDIYFDCNYQYGIKSKNQIDLYRKVFEKKIICSGDIDNYAKKRFKNKIKKEESKILKNYLIKNYNITLEQYQKAEHPSGLFDFEDFYKDNQELFFESPVKKNEIHGLNKDKYLKEKIPDYISYKDYIKLMFNNKDKFGIIRYTSLSSLSKDDKSPLFLENGINYFYPIQEWNEGQYL